MMDSHPRRLPLGFKYVTRIEWLRTLNILVGRPEPIQILQRRLRILIL